MHYCHPDKVSDELKQEAEKVFVDLKNAYDANDFQQVSEILDSLEHGKNFTSASDTITETEKLFAQIDKLKLQVQALERDIENIKNCDTYKTINAIDDWDEYFGKLKTKLSLELEELRKTVV